MEHNAVCIQYCIDVIRAVMRGQTVPEMPEGVTLAELFAFAKKHSVEAMVWNGLCQTNADTSGAVGQNWSNRAEMLLTQSIVQLADRDELFEALTGAGIELLPVKGSWLKEAYPQIDFRQMSDLDALIHEEDRQRARELMLELGYEEENTGIADHHDGYEKKPYTAVELHLSLLSDRSRHKEYYADVWQKAQPVEGSPGLWRFSPEDEYIYYFLHLAKHLDNAGCGVRSILDSAVFRSTYPDMDREYLMQEFGKLEMVQLVQDVEQLADCWFVTGESVPARLMELMGYVLGSGAYGNLENLCKAGMDELRRKYKNPLARVIAYCGPRFFLPLSAMKKDFPVLEKLPVLLPACWVARIVRMYIARPERVKQYLKLLFKEGAKDGKH